MKKLLPLLMCLSLLCSCGTTPQNPNAKTDTKDIVLVENAAKPAFEQKAGIINTIVDGFDVQEVVLWSGIDKGRYKVTSVGNKTKVTILDETPDYYLIQPKNSNLSGYCMKGFVKIN